MSAGGRGRLEPGLDIVGVCWRCVIFEFDERQYGATYRECGSIFGKTVEFVSIPLSHRVDDSLSHRAEDSSFGRRRLLSAWATRCVHTPAGRSRAAQRHGKKTPVAQPRRG